MDASRFDRLARAFTAVGTRRGLLRLIASWPLLGGLAVLLTSDESDADGRHKRRVKRHKHGRPRTHGRHKKRKSCRPKSRAKTCAGRCGTVKDNCQHTVDCGPCACDPPCLEGCCSGNGSCQPGDSDSACGTSGTCVDCGSGRRCLQGACVCDSASCADGCCDAQGQCLPDGDFACGTGGVACAGSCADDGTDPGLDPEESEFLALLNAHRAANGRQVLAPNAQLAAAAEAHSLDMATRGYFSLESPEGVGPRERIISHGYDPDLSEENIAAGQQTAEQVFTSWRNSAGHNEIMLRSGLTEIGIGRAVKPDSDFGWYWTTDFASPAQD